jgi:hypothetical protein
MSEEEAKELKECLKKHGTSIANNPKKSLEILIAAGLVNENGQPTEPYKN